MPVFARRPDPTPDSATPAVFKAPRSVRLFFRALLVLLPIALLATPALAPPAVAQEGASAPVLGEVVDGGSGELLTAVEIVVRSAADSTTVGAALTGADGRYVLIEVGAGEVEVEFRRLGYTPAFRSITIPADAAAAVDMGTIMLLPSAVVLEGVDVVAEQPVVVQTADRDIYRADAIPGSAGGSATDVLEGVPDLEVNIDGQVTMFGEAPAIYINGREAPMQGESLALFLEQFAADNIQSVEVIPNPSARYDADGAGGIVNIVLKEDVGLGLSGNAFVNGGTRGQFGGGGRATYERGPLRLNGGGSLRLSTDESTSNELRQNLLADPMTFLGQDGRSDRSSWSGNLNLRSDYELGSATELEADARIGRNVSEAERAIRYTEMDSEQNPTDVYDRISFDDARGHSMDFALELQHEFGADEAEEREFWERGDELEIGVEFERGRDGDESLVERHLLEEIGAIDYATELTWEEDRETESEMAVSVDYLRGFGGSTEIEVGYESELGWTEESRLQEFRLDGESDPYATEGSGFTHRQTTHGGYLTLMRSFGDLSAQVGARAEHAGNWLELPGETERFGRNYFDVFPSANLSYSLGEGKRVRMSYSMRVRRPSSNVLNPINTSSDELNIRIGNPDIEPQYTHSYTLNTSWSGDLGYLRATPFVRRSVNQWEQLRTVDENGISTTTYENLGSTSSYGVSLTGSLRDFHGFGGRVSLNGSRTDRDYSSVVDRETPSSTRWSVRTNLDREFGSNFRMQGSLVYNPPRDLPYGRASSTTMTRLGLRYRFLDRRASLNVNLSDPFDIYDSSVERSSRSYIEIGRERVSMRRLTMSISYAFQGGGGGGGEGRRGR